MNVIPTLSDTERVALENKAARVYQDVQRLIDELNDTGMRLYDAGLVPQFVGIEMHCSVALDPLLCERFGQPLQIKASFFQCPATKRGKELWKQFSNLYNRQPDVVHQTDRGYIAVFERTGLMPHYVGEDMETLFGGEGLRTLPGSPSLDDLRELFGDHCPSWAKSRGAILQVVDKNGNSK